MKAVSELYAPVTGEVVEVNTALKDKPEAVNADPHATWMIVDQAAEPGRGAARCSTRRSTTDLVNMTMAFDSEPFQSRHIGPDTQTTATRC